MKDYLNELLLQLEADYPEIFDELHGWSARREYGDLKLQIARQNRFIMKHMPTIWAHVDERRVIRQDTIIVKENQTTINTIPLFVVREKTIYRFKKGESKNV